MGEERIKACLDEEAIEAGAKHSRCSWYCIVWHLAWILS